MLARQKQKAKGLDLAPGSNFTSALREKKQLKKPHILQSSFAVKRNNLLLASTNEAQTEGAKTSITLQTDSDISIPSSPCSQDRSERQSPINSKVIPDLREKTPLPFKSRTPSIARNLELKQIPQGNEPAQLRPSHSTKNLKLSSRRPSLKVDEEGETSDSSIHIPSRTTPNKKHTGTILPNTVSFGMPNTCKNASQRTRPAIFEAAKTKSRSKTPVSKNEIEQDAEEGQGKRTKTERNEKVAMETSSYAQKKKIPVNQGYKRPESKQSSQSSLSTNPSKNDLKVGSNGKVSQKSIKLATDYDDEAIFSENEPGSPVTPKVKEIVAIKPTKAKFRFSFPNYCPARLSTKGHGIVEAYAVATNQGPVRDYNEDRVSVLLNITRPSSYKGENWPNCSFFGVFDGHGGSRCADYLRDHLHEFVIGDPNFPQNPKEALRRGFEAAEREFLELAQIDEEDGILERSGSCALVALIVGETCYIANVGDSRAVLSSGSGTRILPLSRDHKPNDSEELKRINQAGGKVYQSQYPGARFGTTGHVTAGPYRVHPGKLSVSRTFGDIEAKLQKYGGNPGCVVAVPEIKVVQIAYDADFIVLASDGVFDTLSNHEALDAIWNSFKNYELAEDLHKQTAIGGDAVLQESIEKGTSDNVTAIIISFNNLRRKLFPKKLGSNDNKENKRRVHSDTKVEVKQVLPLENASSLNKRSFVISNERPSMVSNERPSMGSRERASLVSSERPSIAKSQTVASTDEEQAPQQKPRESPKKITPLENVEIKMPNIIAKPIETPVTKNKPMESLAQTIARKKLAAGKLSGANSHTNETSAVLTSKTTNLTNIK